MNLLPEAIFDQHTIVLGKTRAGKSSVMRGLVEHLSPSLSAIVGLLFRGSPTAILRRVRTIVVHSVYRMEWGRPLSHIAHKCFDVIDPFHTYSYAATSILREVGTVYVEATILDSRPCREFHRFTQTVNPICRRSSFALKATTCLYFLSKVILPNRGLVPAIANTNPQPVLWGEASGLGYHDKPSKSFSYKAWGSSHIFNYTQGSVIGGEYND